MSQRFCIRHHVSIHSTTGTGRVGPRVKNLDTVPSLGSPAADLEWWISGSVISWTASRDQTVDSPLASLQLSVHLVRQDLWMMLWQAASFGDSGVQF